MKMIRNGIFFFLLSVVQFYVCSSFGNCGERMSTLRSAPLCFASATIQKSFMLSAHKLFDVEESTFKNGLRGMRAVTDIGPNAVLAIVAHKSTIEVTDDKHPSPFPDFVQPKIWQISLWYQRMAFNLLYIYKGSEKGKNESYEWIRTLPRSFATPLHWNEYELDQLQYPALGEKVLKQREDWRLFYDNWQMSSSESSPARACAYVELEWAVECCLSRAFSDTHESSPAQQRSSSLLLFAGLLGVAWPVLGLGGFEQSLGAVLTVGSTILIRDMIYSKLGAFKR